eukprot:1157692-Pelagomonas_calceolata.AAC.1
METVWHVLLTADSIAGAGMRRRNMGFGGEQGRSAVCTLAREAVWHVLLTVDIVARLGGT